MSPLSPHRPRKIAKKSQPEQPDATDFSEFLISFSLFLKLAGFLLVFKVLREQPRIIKRSYLLSICSIKRTFKRAGFFLAGEVYLYLPHFWDYPGHQKGIVYIKTNLTQKEILR